MKTALSVGIKYPRPNAPMLSIAVNFADQRQKRKGIVTVIQVTLKNKGGWSAS
jgi:hypothetical protein